jgi:hypothetical protein
MGRLVCLVMLLTVVACGGISTRSGDDEATGTAPAGGSTSASGGSRSNDSPAGGGGGGAAITGGASNSSGGVAVLGGSGPTGGTAIVSGGSAGAAPIACGGEQRLPLPGSACLGIKNGMSCAAEGQLCPCRACGLADLGRRNCNCVGGIWTCTPCEHPENWSLPPDLPFCTNQVDRLACAAEGQACQGAPAGEVCICYVNDDGVLVWDCDKPPMWGPW